MKLMRPKLLAAVSVLLLLSQALSTKAQENYESNIVKLNVTALAFRNFQVQYERMLTPRMSIALAGRFMPEGQIPLLGVAEKFIDDLQTFQDLKNLQVKGTSFQPEIRFYLGKSEGAKGFYLAPYATISRYPIRYDNFKFQHEESINNQTYHVEKVANLQGHVQGVSGGLMVGAQWNLGKLLTLDWWIVGASYGASKGNLKATVDEDLDSEWQQALKERLEELQIPKVKLDNEVHSRGVNSALSGPWANFRSGLSLGFRF